MNRKINLYREDKEEETYGGEEEEERSGSGEAASEGEVKKGLGIDLNREKGPLVEAIFRLSTP